MPDQTKLDELKKNLPEADELPETEPALPPYPESAGEAPRPPFDPELIMAAYAGPNMMPTMMVYAGPSYFNNNQTPFPGIMMGPAAQDFQNNFAKPEEEKIDPTTIPFYPCCGCQLKSRQRFCSECGTPLTATWEEWDRTHTDNEV